MAAKHRTSARDEEGIPPSTANRPPRDPGRPPGSQPRAATSEEPASCHRLRGNAGTTQAPYRYPHLATRRPRHPTSHVPRPAAQQWHCTVPFVHPLRSRRPSRQHGESRRLSCSGRLPRRGQICPLRIFRRYRVAWARWPLSAGFCNIPLLPAHRNSPSPAGPDSATPRDTWTRSLVKLSDRRARSRTSMLRGALSYALMGCPSTDGPRAIAVWSGPWRAARCFNA